MSRLRLTDAIVAEAVGRASSGDLAKLLVEHCFDKQLEAVDSEEKTLILSCGRRAGKTVVILVLLLTAALAHPGEIALYVVWRRSQIRTTIWAEAKRIAKRYDLPIDFRETDRQFFIYVPGGGVVWLTGCDDEAEVEKFRGARFAIAVVDEMGSYGEYLRSMIEDAIEPALSDLNARLVVSGTPGLVPSGYWYEISTGDAPDVDAWPLLDWTCLDNPHHASEEWVQAVTVAEMLERWPKVDPKRDTLAMLDDGRVLVPGPRLAKRGWGPSHPTFLREWCNRWVIDREALAYPFESDRNCVDELPEGEFRYVLGVDLGASQDKPTTAFVLLAYQTHMPTKYVVWSEKRAGQTPNAIGARIEWFRERYRIHCAVVDAGGLGGAYVQQFVEDGIPAEAAEKRQKMAYHEWCRGDILAGALMLVTSNPGHRDLIDEARAVTVEDLSEDIGVDHLLDALLYAWRKARTAYRPEKEDPQPGDRGYAMWERKVRKRAAAEKVARRRQTKKRW